MGDVFRIYVEKKAEFAVEAKHILQDLTQNLQIKGLKNLRVINRYDVEGISREAFDQARNVIFAEPQVDTSYFELPKTLGRLFAIEYLPGQFDQRADSCAQCIQLLTQGARPVVRTAKVYILEGDISDSEFDKIKSYLINPVESREAALDTFETLTESYHVPEKIEVLRGFISMDDSRLAQLLKDMGLAMDIDDIKFCQNYFKNTEKRDPTVTEIRVIDTYWSDHCRHTTFLTSIDSADIQPDYIQKAYKRYLDAREKIGLGHKPVTLMDIAVSAMKYLKKTGQLKNLDESDEINACSVKIQVDVDGEMQDWLLMFKNETHNHPTEIEPFGGAATCLGGAIRDPLSGRSYVYQAMRVTGSADPTAPIESTLKGKLPQRKITTTAAAGYSSYGNQIGLATGLVSEVYHPGYVAKRLEIGAVCGAAPAENVKRQAPEPGDVVILIGGRTGRDGCGGATGSSKSHTLESLVTCGAEVQKGNPPEERKLQRLFRKPEVAKMIKRCNDFGAGGVSVAIGELADGLFIDLNAVPKKYEGLDGTELAISESQERMAVVVAPHDVERFIKEANLENIEATPVAKVTENPRLVMQWNGETIVDISREFLSSNGAEKHAAVFVPEPDVGGLFDGLSSSDSAGLDRLADVLSDLNVCSQKGLAQRFDSTIGAGTVTMPFGGRHQLTPTQFMSAKIPVLNGDTDTCSVMAYGFNPYISERSPFHGAIYAVVESISKLVASGADYKSAYLTLQEYFERTKNQPSRWGKPFAALLGAFTAQLELGVAAIGGKDSMSGSFEDIDVPPTLVSFAIAAAKASKNLTPEFKNIGSRVYLIKPRYTQEFLPDFESLKQVFEKIHLLANQGSIISAWALGFGGVGEAVAKMCFGNQIGFRFDDNFDSSMLFSQYYGAFVVEAAEDAGIDGILLGNTIPSKEIVLNGKSKTLDELLKAWQRTLEPVFPTKAEEPAKAIPAFGCTVRARTSAVKIARPRVFIPVFPGTNCEYDTVRQFEKAGAVCDIQIIRNLSPEAIEDTVNRVEKSIKNSQIIMLPGGFSGGDEPDGSGKFIGTFFRNPRIKEAVTDLLKNRDGLILGICNGFKALIKLGLVPFGEIVDMDENCPTLTFNTIGRHQSMMVRTRIASVKSPWLANVNVGDIHTIPISHGEGRFVADEKLIMKLAENGQIATQYVDLDGKPTMDIAFNPNGSMFAIEGILSPDGRVFGKMGHSERIGENIAKNVPGNKDQMIFAAGVDYFRN